MKKSSLYLICALITACIAAGSKYGILLPRGYDYVIGLPLILLTFIFVYLWKKS